jgi:hypothetical protein
MTFLNRFDSASIFKMFQYMTKPLDEYFSSEVLKKDFDLLNIIIAKYNHYVTRLKELPSGKKLK